jgi:hypothetical protein
MTSNRFMGFLLGATSLFLLYFVVALRQHNFVFTSFWYWDDYWTYYFGIPNEAFQSQLWKIILLLPATILLSVALTKAGLHFALPEKISYRLIVGAALLTATVVLILSTQFLFRETEVTDDEIAYDFQAKTLLAGRIVNPPPPVPGRSMSDPLSGLSSFDDDQIINDGHQWTGKYTLGHPVIIALGMALGNRYIATIGISVLTLLLLYLIAKELYNDKKIALLAFCLGCVSPFFYLVSSSRLSHTTCAFFLALFMYLFLRSRHIQDRPQKAVMVFLAGLAVGYAFNVRPLTAVGFALPFSVFWAMNHPRVPRRTFLTGFLMFAGFSLMLTLTLWYNSIVTGNWLQFPFSYFSSWQSVGFNPRHTPFSAAHNLAVSTFRMNGALFGFPLSLLFVFVAVFIKKEFADRFLFGILGGIVCVYFFYFSPGVQDLGPIYYYEALIPLSILSARGFLFLYKTIFDRFEGGRTFVLHFLVTSCLVALATYVPERIRHIARLTEEVRVPYETVRAANIHHALIMIRGWPSKGHVQGYRNPSPALDDDIIYCLYDSLSNRALVDCFPDRAPYLLRHDRETDHVKLSPLDRSTLQPKSLKQN